MTPRERAEALLKQWDGKNMWKQEISLDIEQAIIAAVEEEREACAKIAEDAIGARRREIAKAIRAPCNSIATENKNT